MRNRSESPGPSADTRPAVLIVGPTPPPHHGVSIATESILHSSLADRFRLIHLDTSDRRGIQHVDHPDVHDVVLFIKQWFRMIRLLRAAPPALVYLPLSQSTIGFVRDTLFMIPAWLSGAEVMVHLHGGNFKAWYGGRARLVRSVVRRVLRRVAYAVVLGESLRGLFDGLIAPFRVAVVPNGIHWPPVRRTERRPDAARRYTVLHLSTLNRLKGATVLLAAVPLVLKVRHDVDFVLAGPWSHEADRLEAEALMLHHGLADHVVFTGPVTTLEHKRSIYSSADLFVFPGVQQEGQPLVVLEAMASGLPVLFTDRGCLRETVIEGECGLEVRINDPHHLADRILWCLAHPMEMERMGHNARERFERFYTSERFVRRLGDWFTLACRDWKAAARPAPAEAGGATGHRLL